MIFGTWFLRSTRAEPGCVVVTVLFKDDYPVENATVKLKKGEAYRFCFLRLKKITVTATATIEIVEAKTM